MDISWILVQRAIMTCEIEGFDDEAAEIRKLIDSYLQRPATLIPTPGGELSHAWVDEFQERKRPIEG